MTTMKKRYLRYDDTELDEESLRIAKEEVKEDDENKGKLLENLKRKLLDKENLNPCIEEEFLLGYLRVAKYDLSAAYDRIIKFYDDKLNMPEVFMNYSPSSVKLAESARGIYLSPYRSKDNGVILIVKIRKDYDPAIIPSHVILRAATMSIEYIQRHPLNQLCGLHLILDFKCSSWKILSECTPNRLKMLARLLQKSIGLRFCSIHVLNAPSTYYLLYSIIYPFLSAKIKKRIFIHRNYPSIHSYFDPEILPEEYEGCLKHSELINVYERLYEKEDFFRKISEYGFIKKKI